jgi:hopanoid C-2 methylase
MRCALTIASRRRVLCVFPAYTSSFGTFCHAYRLKGRVRAFMPPQGLLVIAAYLPESWSVRFIDENISAATAADFAWADIVFVSGMHIQAPQIHDIAARARAAGKVSVLGGSSVSGAPELYPEFDYLHIGEVGDATDRLIAMLDKSIALPTMQIRMGTQERVPLADFPLPAYDLVRLDRYLIGSLQFSSGCPYRCEFCDIPALYGRQPRLKTSDQIIAELDAMLAQPGHPPVVYFVDDNFIGNRKAAREMLPQLIEWQRKHSYPLQFACEATLNLAKQAEILSLMREAQFVTVFVGIETPEVDALKAMRKEQNAALPMMEAIKTINNYGIEVTSGVILGLDTDTADSEARVKEFIDVSQVPVLTINLLQALPRTPLWDRLQRDGRLIADDRGLESNIRFLRPYDEVVASWQRCIAHAYDPERLFARYAYQVETTYPHRIKTPARGKLTVSNLRAGLVVAFNVALRVGLLSDYRRAFWRAALKASRRGQIDTALAMGFVGHHLIQFTREALRGEQNASYYSAQTREPALADAKALRSLRQSPRVASQARNFIARRLRLLRQPSLRPLCRRAAAHVAQLWRSVAGRGPSRTMSVPPGHNPRARSDG